MCACFQGTPGGSEPEPSGEEETPTDTLWVGRIPVNLVGGDMASILNINANKNISSLFSQFGKVKHSTVRIKNGENKSWALITFEDVESATRAKQEVRRATPHYTTSIAQMIDHWWTYLLPVRFCIGRLSAECWLRRGPVAS